MTDKSRSHREHKIFWFVCLLIGVIFILISALIEEKTHGEKERPFEVRLAISLLLEFGIAVIVAWVVVVTIEKYTRTKAEDDHGERIESIQESVFKAVHGIYLPNELVDNLNSQIFRCPLHRSEIELDYHFRKQNLSAEYLNMTVNVRYKLNSVCGKEVEVPLEFYFESLIATSDHFVSLTVYNGIHRINLLEDELKSYVTRDGIRVVLKYDKIIVNPGHDTTIEYVYQATRRMTDSDTWLSRHPAIGLRLAVTVHDPDLEIEFFRIPFITTN